MKTHLLISASLVIATLNAGAAKAQSHAHQHAPSAASSAAAPTVTATAAVEMSDAEVRKMDKDAKKVTLKHGPIKSLDMPPMTMVFQVRDVSLLDKAKAGDKIKFTAEQREGAYVVTRIEPIPTK